MLIMCYLFLRQRVPQWWWIGATQANNPNSSNDEPLGSDFGRNQSARAAAVFFCPIVRISQYVYIWIGPPTCEMARFFSSDFLYSFARLCFFQLQRRHAITSGFTHACMYIQLSSTSPLPGVIWIERIIGDNGFSTGKWMSWRNATKR